MIDATGSADPGSPAGAARERLARGEPVEDATLDADALRAAVAAAAGPVVLRRCTLAGADGERVDLRELDLTGATIEGCVLRDALLRGAILDGAVVRGGDLGGVDLADADLTDAVLDTVDLHRVRLTGALLTDTRFTDCRMVGADLRGLRGLALTARFDGSSLALADLSDAALRGHRFVRVDLSEADLRGADLRDAVFTDCRLREVDLSHSRVDGADLRGADLGELSPDTPRALRGAVISTEQAADVCRAFGLLVGEGGLRPRRARSGR